MQSFVYDPYSIIDIEKTFLQDFYSNSGANLKEMLDQYWMFD